MIAADARKKTEDKTNEENAIQAGRSFPDCVLDMFFQPSDDALRSLLAEAWNEPVRGNVTYAAVNPSTWSAARPVEISNEAAGGDGNNEARKNSIGIYFPDGFDAALKQAVDREASLGRKN